MIRRPYEVKGDIRDNPGNIYPTVCNKIKWAYHMTDDPELQDLLINIYIITRRRGRRLRWYKKRFDEQKTNDLNMEKYKKKIQDKIKLRLITHEKH